MPRVWGLPEFVPGLVPGRSGKRRGQATSGSRETHPRGAPRRGRWCAAGGLGAASVDLPLRDGSFICRWRRPLR